MNHVGGRAGSSRIQHWCEVILCVACTCSSCSLLLLIEIQAINFGHALEMTCRDHATAVGAASPTAH